MVDDFLLRVLLLLGHGGNHRHRRRRRFVLIKRNYLHCVIREDLCGRRLTYEKKVKSKSMQRKRKSGMNNKHDGRVALTLKEIAEIADGGRDEHSYAGAGEFGRRRLRVLARFLLFRVRVRVHALLFLLFLFLRAPR